MRLNSDSSSINTPLLRFTYRYIMVDFHTLRARKVRRRKKNKKGLVLFFYFLLLSVSLPMRIHCCISCCPLSTIALGVPTRIEHTYRIVAFLL